MSWDPVCKCGHEASAHGCDTHRNTCTDPKCDCDLGERDVARRAALLEAELRLRQVFPGLSTIVTDELRRMAEEPPK